MWRLIQKEFVEDYSFCIHSQFQQVYATSRHFSWTDAREFAKFCRDAGIPCEPLPVERYFKEGSCDGAFLTQEYTYDAHILRDYFLEELGKYKGVELLLGRDIKRIVKRADRYEIHALYQGKPPAAFPFHTGKPGRFVPACHMRRKGDGGQGVKSGVYDLDEFLEDERGDNAAE